MIIKTMNKEADNHSRKLFLAGLFIGALAFPITVASLLGADNVLDFIKNSVLGLDILGL